MTIANDLNLKRVLDLIGASIGLAMTAPIMAVISSVILITMGSPVLFVQRRPGLSGFPFDLYKFRTMTGHRDYNNNWLPDCRRLTLLGRLLRDSSLDELPELFNVIRGELSLVGPRPLLMQYLDRYSTEQARRHEVKPGLTGWAQINGRNAISWDEKFKLDVWYVDNQSIWLDLKIIALTIVKVLKREGISHAGEATMTEFLGHAKEQRSKDA